MATTASPTAAPSDALVLFGASGDVAHKMVLPALYALCRHGRLNVPIVGVAISGWNLDDLKTHAMDAVQKAGDFDAKVFGRFADLMRYIDGDPKAKGMVVFSVRPRRRGGSGTRVICKCLAGPPDASTLCSTSSQAR